MENGGREVQLDSGASLYISVAPWQEVKALQDAFARAMVGSGISQSEVAAVITTVKFRASVAPGAKDDVHTPDEKLSAIAALTRKALELASNTDLEHAIFACAEKAMYRHDGTKESSVQFKLAAPGYAVFDNPACRDKARGDYYAICTAVLEENLRPFVQALFSMFAAHVGSSADIRKSTTAQESTKQP